MSDASGGGEQLTPPTPPRQHKRIAKAFPTTARVGTCVVETRPDLHIHPTTARVGDLRSHWPAGETAAPDHRARRDLTVRRTHLAGAPPALKAARDTGGHSAAVSIGRNPPVSDVGGLPRARSTALAAAAATSPIVILGLARLQRVPSVPRTQGEAKFKRRFGSSVHPVPGKRQLCVSKQTERRNTPSKSRVRRNPGLSTSEITVFLGPLRRTSVGATDIAPR